MTGPVGAGKTTLLTALAAWWKNRGKRVDGVLAEADPRRAEGRGASQYVLRWLASDDREPFAVRDETLSPPYRIDPDALRRLEEWSETLGMKQPAPLLILDEFGRLEASGGGLMRIWPKVAAAAPEIVVIGVRGECIQDIEARFGCRFDVRVDPRDPDAWDRVRAACVEHADWSRVGVYGAGSGGMEATIGSALHGAQVPLRGLALSTTQAAVMAHAGEGLGRRARVVWVPFIAAGLKALSPAGSRLRPMLAITIQGVLFTAATSLLGWNVLGIGVGGALVGMWATAQGFLLQYLLIGSDLLRAYESVLRWLSDRLDFGVPGLITALAIWIGSWGLVSGTVTLLVWRRRALPPRLNRLMERGSTRIRLGPHAGGRIHALAHAARDVARPVFWMPVLLVVGILLVAGTSMERVFWISARAATVGFVLFALVRMVDPPRVLDWLRARGHWGPAIAFARALDGRRDGPGNSSRPPQS